MQTVAMATTKNNEGLNEVVYGHSPVESFLSCLSSFILLPLLLVDAQGLVQRALLAVSGSLPLGRQVSVIPMGVACGMVCARATGVDASTLRVFVSAHTS